MTGAEMALAGAAAVGLYVWFDSSRRTHAVTSGVARLEARVPYRLTLITDAPVSGPIPTMELQDRQTGVRGELIPFGAYDVAFATTTSGRSTVSFTMTPPAPVPLSIGAQLSAEGEFAPGLTLTRVERLDGKPMS